MKVPTIESLNKTFAFSKGNNYLIFKEGKGNIPVIEIKNKSSSAVISLQGAHLLSWIPNNEDDVIWLSEDAVFSPSKSIRGGIPICWPWFGAHESNKDFPAHGFARTVFWNVKEVKRISDDETCIVFSLETKKLDNIHLMWPMDTIVEYSLTISKTLTLELKTINSSKSDITIGQALHTYFNVEDVSSTTVYGLEGKKYLDKPDNFKVKTQEGVINFNSEVDRVYLETSDDIIIDDTKRKILIKKQGSQSTVVWNPWEKVAQTMGDLGCNGYLKMLCVESANAASDTVEIKPGKFHALSVTYKLASL